MQKENPEQISTQFATVESIDEYRQGSATWCKSNKKNKKYQKDIRRTKNNFREWQNKYINNKLSAIIFSFFNIILCHLIYVIFILVLVNI
jgi:hypothetical protein